MPGTIRAVPGIFGYLRLRGILPMSVTTIEPPKLLLIRFFGPGVADSNPSKETLGGKAYSLMTMTAAGLPVPPGFTITTQCCAEYYDAGKKWPQGLEDELREAMDWL